MRGRLQFSIRLLAAGMVLVALCLAVYVALRRQDARQRALMERLQELDAGFFEHDPPPKHPAHLLGLDFPADRVRAIRGSTRPDWGIVPGWACSPPDLVLLHRFSNLEELYLSGTTLATADLQGIAKLPKLEWLELQSCDLSQADIGQLGTLTRLQHLRLMDCQLPPDAKSTLQQALPDCDVDGRPAPW